MTIREIVLKTMEALMKEREQSGEGAYFWLQVCTTDRVNKITRVLSADEDDKEIIELTLAHAEADYWAQKINGDWPIWQHNTSGEISTRYTPKGDRDNWRKISEFNTAIHDIRDLGKEYQALGMPERYDKYMNEWWDAVAEGYADAIEEIEERNEERRKREEGLEPEEDIERV